MFEKEFKGAMIECPDLNQVLGCLLLSEQFQPKEEGQLNVHTSRWHLGELDYSTGLFNETAKGTMDYGFDLYAPQTFAGEPIAIG